MLGSALRVLVIFALTAAAVLVAVTYDRPVALVMLSVLAGVPVLMWILLPRAAHRAFRRGDYKRSKLLYKLLRFWVISRTSRAAVDVSLAACALAGEEWSESLAMLDRIDARSLGDAARAAWLNNRAYALARADRDPHHALACSEEAIRLRPDVAGFRHTRGVALLALGRVDEAIAELERLWEELSAEAGDEAPLLEAERCYDLGLAWKRKGERDYATDYFHRARRASPGSRWAERATSYLEPNVTARNELVLTDFLDA